MLVIFTGLLTVVIPQTFRKRASEIADHAHNSRGALGEGVEFLRGLDETERQCKSSSCPMITNRLTDKRSIPHSSRQRQGDSDLVRRSQKVKVKTKSVVYLLQVCFMSRRHEWSWSVSVIPVPLIAIDGAMDWAFRHFLVHAGASPSLDSLFSSHT